MQLAHRPAGVPTRAGAMLLSFGPLVAAVAAGCLAAFVVTPVAVALVTFAALSFIAMPILLWVFLLTGVRRLDEGLAAYLAGRAAAAEPGARRVLRTVVRGDMRARATHLLALAAEERGSFAEAAELFARTEQALPAMAAPARKAQVRVLIGSHRAICLALSGRVAEATELLSRVHADFARGQVTGLTDSLLDDSTWGMGSLSMNEMILKIEGPRPPLAVLTLAWVVVHHARGAAADLLDVVAREGAHMTHGLLPREHALVERLVSEARASQGGGGVWRSPGQLPAAQDPWVDLVLQGASAARPALEGGR